MQCRTVRSLITLVLTILVGPWLADAQGPTRVSRLGVLTSALSADDAALAAFLQALHDLGYREGHNLRIDFRFAAQQLDRLPALAAELVTLQPDVIFTAGTPGVRAAQQATTTIPIVVGVAGDLVTQGIVASYARPGGNITGLTLTTDVVGKRVELLKEAVPTITRMALLFNPANPASALTSVPEVLAASRALGIQVQRVEARHADELDAAFRVIVAGGVDALFIQNDGILNAEAPRIAAFALKHRLPTSGGNLGYARAGWLMTYSESGPDLFRRAASYVDKILKGAKPADLPLERADKFFLVINLKTAKALGVTIPPHLLVQADEVIQFATAQVAVHADDLIGTWELVSTKVKTGDVVRGLNDASTSIQWMQFTRSHFMVVAMERGRSVMNPADFAKLSPEEKVKTNYARIWNEKNEPIFGARAGTYTVEGDKIHQTATMALNTSSIGVDFVLTITHLDKSTMVAQVEVPVLNPIFTRELTYRRID